MESSDRINDLEEISNVLSAEVLKREVLDGEKADEARKRIARAARKSLRVKAAPAENPVTPELSQPAVGR